MLTGGLASSFHCGFWLLGAEFASVVGRRSGKWSFARSRSHVRKHMKVKTTPRGFHAAAKTIIRHRVHATAFGSTAVPKMQNCAKRNKTAIPQMFCSHSVSPNTSLLGPGAELCGR